MRHKHVPVAADTRPFIEAEAAIMRQEAREYFILTGVLGAVTVGLTIIGPEAWMYAISMGTIGVATGGYATRNLIGARHREHAIQVFDARQQG